MIFNQTQQKIISPKEISCNNILSQARGLMFKKPQSLIMKFSSERKVSLHMFFVFYPIDILVVNKEMKIVEIKKNFKPWTLWKSKNKGKYVVELANPAKYEINDKIKID